MVFVKGDFCIVVLYDRLFVKDDYKFFGEKLRNNYNEIREFVLKVFFKFNIIVVDILVL